MKLVNWFRGNPQRGVLPPPPPPLSLLTADVQSETGMLPVVGTSHYQPALRDLLDQHPERQARVIVACELDNAHDPNAVIVKDTNHRPLGYLPHNVAAPLCKRLALAGDSVLCPAELQGGTADDPTVRLTVDGAPLREQLAAQAPRTSQ